MIINHLCHFCANFGDDGRCLAARQFRCPVGQRVLCCDDFKQLTYFYCDVVYTAPTTIDDTGTLHLHNIGSVVGRTFKRQRNKNQINLPL